MWERIEIKMPRRIFVPRVHEEKEDWRKYVMLCLISCPTTLYFSDANIENNELGVACVTMGLRRGLYKVLEGKTLEGTHLESPRVDGTIILQ
jgi:hypothetical protein